MARIVAEAQAVRSWRLAFTGAHRVVDTRPPGRRGGAPLWAVATAPQRPCRIVARVGPASPFSSPAYSRTTPSLRAHAARCTWYATLPRMLRSVRKQTRLRCAGRCPERAQGRPLTQRPAGAMHDTIGAPPLLRCVGHMFLNGGRADCRRIAEKAGQAQNKFGPESARVQANLGRTPPASAKIASKSARMGPVWDRHRPMPRPGVDQNWRGIVRC